MNSNNNRIPPGRAGQNSNTPAGRAGQSVQRIVVGRAQNQPLQIQLPPVAAPPLTVAGFNRRGFNQTGPGFSGSSPVLVDLTQPGTSNFGTNNNSVTVQPTSFIGSVGRTHKERKVIKLTRGQELQQLKQRREQEAIRKNAVLKEAEFRERKKRSKRKRESETKNVGQFSVDQWMAYETKRKRRNDLVDRVVLSIIHRIFGSATIKVEGQIVEYVPSPIDLTVDRELMDANNPSSYNFWISNIGGGLRKRLTELTVRPIYKIELDTPFIQLELPKHAISLAIMVWENRSVWGYISLLPQTDGLRFVLMYQLPVPLDWDKEGNEMQTQIQTLQQVYDQSLNDMMIFD